MRASVFAGRWYQTGAKKGKKEKKEATSRGKRKKNNKC